jgi:hypothetical protein
MMATLPSWNEHLSTAVPERHQAANTGIYSTMALRRTDNGRSPVIGRNSFYRKRGETQVAQTVTPAGAHIVSAGRGRLKFTE